MQKSARMCWERQTRTEPQKDTQTEKIWPDLANVAVESHKEPKLKNSSTQQAVQHKQTSGTITEGWNNKLARMELGADRCRWLTGDEFQVRRSQDGREPGLHGSRKQPHLTWKQTRNRRGGGRKHQGKLRTGWPRSLCGCSKVRAFLDSRLIYKPKYKMFTTLISFPQNKTKNNSNGSFWDTFPDPQRLTKHLNCCRN